MLTDAQKATLKAAILADPVLAPISSGPATDYNSIMLALNADASPVTKAWRTSMSVGELTEETVSNIAKFDNLTAGKRDAWNLFLRLPALDFTRNKVRSAVGKVWDATERDAILGACTENASKAEVIFGGTSTTEGGVTALKRNFVGDVSVTDVAETMNS